MAGIEFDRQAFIPPVAPQPTRPAIQLFGPLLSLLVVALVAFVGYKIYLVNDHNSDVAATNAQLQQLQQELTEMQKRLDGMEKHRRTAQAEPTSPKTTSTNTIASSVTRHASPVYHIEAASSLPAQVKPTTPAHTQPMSPASSNPAYSQQVEGEAAANREAWEATTNRLADVVGVVGTQQGELSETRDAVNQLLAQAHRKAVSFELDRSSKRVPVGPVKLQLKSTDSKAQHYTLCVTFNSQNCIELKDRALNEVVVFVVAKNSPPLELVATKIQRDQIVGYLEIPSNLQ